MLKNTSIASVIGFGEIVYVTSDISATNYKTIQLLIVGSIWYLALTSVAYVGQYFLERKVGQGFSRSQQATMKERWLSLGQRRQGGRAMSDVMVARRGRAQALRHQRGAEGHHADASTAARSCACSDRRARASRPSCAASTTWRRSTPAACRSTASWSATARPTASSTSCTSARSPSKRQEIGMVFQQFNLFPHMTALENVTLAPTQVLRRNRDEADRRAPRAARPGRPQRQVRRPSGRALRRPAAARRDRPRAGDGPEADAVRRADLGARPRAGRRGARRDARPGQERHDDDRGHARDRLRPRGRRHGRVHGRRRRRRGRATGRGARRAQARAHQVVPVQGSSLEVGAQPP